MHFTNLKAPACRFPLEGKDVPTVAAKLKLVELVAAVLGAVSNEEVAAAMIEVVVSGRASRQERSDSDHTAQRALIGSKETM